MIKVKLDSNTKDYLKSKLKIININSCIYFLKFNDEVVYVGKTTNLNQRIVGHIAEKAKAFNDFDIISCPKELLNETETAYIVMHDPIFNKRDSLTNGITLSEFCDTNNVCYGEYENNSCCVPMKALTKRFDVPVHTLRNWEKDKTSWRRKLYDHMIKIYLQERLANL